MMGQSVVVTYAATTEEKTLFLEILGKSAHLTFLNEIPPAQRTQSLEQATALVAWNFPQEVPSQQYTRLPQGAFIQLVTAGADHMPFTKLPPHLTVASNAGAYATPMAEHNAAMILALAKRLLVEHKKLMRNEFDDATPTRSLFGATAAIIGFGGSGRATARLLQAFGMRIFALNQSGKSTTPTDFIGTLHDLEHVLRVSDVVPPLFAPHQGDQRTHRSQRARLDESRRDPCEYRPWRAYRRGGALYPCEEPSGLSTRH